MALTAFASFSALVAVSVAMSNGSAPAPWESAYASEASDESAGNQQNRGAFGQITAGDQGESHPSLFAAVPDEALLPNVQDTPQDYVASQVRNVSDAGTESAPSSVAPAKRAPATFEGELPFNTIIAPAQPPTVLDGGQFGWRTAPDTGDREFHNGTDISTSEGTPVVAALEGTVTAVFWDEWGGNRVEVSHADGVKTTYNHLKDVMVQVGDPLTASEQLGTIGQTGLRVTGPHLHFETWVQGKAVDAQSFDWETGEGIIPASRPKYSLEDQARTDQATTDNGSAPGTDNGPVSEVPADEQEHIIALSQETAPAEDSAAGASDGDAASGSDAAAKAGSDGGAASGPAPEASAAKAQPSQAQEPKTSPTESRSAQPSPSRSSSSSNDDVEGRVTAGGTSGETSGDTASRPSGGTSQGSGSGASSNSSEKDTRKKPDAVDKPDATKKPTPSKPAAVPEPTKPASTGDPVKPAPANTGKPTPQPTPSETGTSNPQPTVGETDKPKPAPTNTKKPVPVETAAPTDKPQAPQPETTKPANPANPVDPKPETTKPAVPGTPAEPGTATEAPKPETPSKTDKPAKPTVNPYTADITTLTTLEQLQQRTQVLVNQQLVLTPEQQFGPRSQLNVQLPLLSQQLVAAELDQQAPKFTAQLAATQTAVEKAAAAPKNKRLTAAATAELTKLQTMLAKVPVYVDPAAAPAG